MKLNEYLEKYDKSPREFAKSAGISQAVVYRYLRGHTPTLRIALLIQEITKDMVTARELLGDDQ